MDQRPARGTDLGARRVRIVFDTGVLSRALSRTHPESEQVLQKATEPCTHKILLSRSLLKELRGMSYQTFGLPARLLLQRLDSPEIVRKLREVKLIGLSVPFNTDDDHLLELAVRGKADYIITLDRADLIDHRGEMESWGRGQHSQFRIVSPYEFLESLKQP